MTRTAISRLGSTRRGRLVAMAAGLSLVAAACANGDTPENDETPEGPAEEDAAGGGTFIIGGEAQIESLDPQSNTSLMVQRPAGQIYDTLVVADPGSDNEILPYLAEDFEASEDGLTYTFTLRDDVTFHNGEPLTADDVAFTFDRWVSGDSPNNWILDGYESAEEIDEHTVAIHLSEPRFDLLSYLARNDASILNRMAVEEAGDAYGATDAAVGTGPFRVESWSPTDDLVLTRFEDYNWGPEALYENTGPALVDELIWRAVPDTQTRLLEVQQGNIHAVPPRIPFHEVDNLEEADGVHLERFPLGSTVLLGFHLNSPNQGEREVRQAILHAMDRGGIVDDVLYGHARLGDSLVAYGFPGYCECDDVIPEHDPAAAEQILDEAGWEPGADGIRERDGDRLEVYATILDLVPYPDAYTVVQEQLRAVGIDLIVQASPSAQVFEMFAEGTHGLWSISIPHNTPVEAMFNYLHSSSIPTPNRIPYDEPEMDALLEQLRASTDEDEYLELAEQIQRAVLEEYVLIPWWHEEGIIAVNDGVEGFTPFPYANHLFYKMLDVTVED